MDMYSLSWPHVPQNSMTSHIHPDTVTHDDLRAESAAVMKALARQAEITRDQLYHLQKTHTIARMTADLYGRTAEHPYVVAKDLYNKVEKSLEIDRTIVGAIPAA